MKKHGRWRGKVETRPVSRAVFSPERLRMSSEKTDAARINSWKEKEEDWCDHKSTKKPEAEICRAFLTRVSTGTENHNQIVVIET